MLRIVHQMQIACQAQFASDAVAKPAVKADYSRMPPVKKTRAERGRHYLREWRKYRKKQDRKWTLAYVAELVEVDHSSLSRLERGESPYDEDILQKLALAYGCDPADLLNINPLTPDPPKLVYDRLRAAPKELQDRALAVLDALLRAG